MNAEYLLDAVGLLDDGLIQEAETYTLPVRRSHSGGWLTLAASLVVVIALGYVLNGGLRGPASGGSAAPSASGGGAQSVEAAGSQGFSGGVNSGSNPAVPEGPGSFPQDNVEPGTPGEPSGGSESGEWLDAIRADGVVYRATNKYIHLEPEEDDIRYTTSFVNSAEPEEDGQANFLPVGSAYVILDNGTAAVYHEDDGTWCVFDSVPPRES